MRSAILRRRPITLISVTPSRFAGTPEPGGMLPDGGLRHLPDRKPDTGQSVLAEHVQHIRLVFGSIGGPE